MFKASTIRSQEHRSTTLLRQRLSCAIAAVSSAVSRAGAAKRLLLVALALLLPLQLSWASAAAYCEHESTPAATAHFGHHGHHHSASAEKQKPSKLTLDNDCGTCHASCAQALSDGIELTQPLQLQQHPEPVATAALTSAPLAGPDRPNWSDLA